MGDNMDDLFNLGQEIKGKIGVLERRIRQSITAYAIRVAEAFLASGCEVYTVGLMVNACWHEGGVPALLVKDLPKETVKRWWQIGLVDINDYNEFRLHVPVHIEESAYIRLTIDNLEEVARERWSR